jgi:hypothetical protein
MLNRVPPKTRTSSQPSDTAGNRFENVTLGVDAAIKAGSFETGWTGDVVELRIEGKAGVLRVLLGRT